MSYYVIVSIRSRLFEAGERLSASDRRIHELFQSAPASLRRENRNTRHSTRASTGFNPLPPL